MYSIVRSFSLCTAVFIASTDLSAQELTADDYPDGRDATRAEITEHCNSDDNPNSEVKLLSFDQDEEYPFQLIFCDNTPHVRPYKCSTLSNLINFEFAVSTLFHHSGKEMNEEVERLAGQFSGLINAYEENCIHLIY